MTVRVLNGQQDLFSAAAAVNKGVLAQAPTTLVAEVRSDTHVQDMVGTELANANDELQAQVAAAAAQEARIKAMQQTLLNTGLGFAAVILDLKVCLVGNTYM